MEIRNGIQSGALCDAPFMLGTARFSSAETDKWDGEYTALHGAVYIAGFATETNRLETGGTPDLLPHRTFQWIRLSML